MEEIEKPYSIWMRAEPPSINHTAESKWLRRRGVAPVEGLGTRKDGSTSVTTTKIFFEDGHNSKKSGTHNNILILLKHINRSVIQGTAISDIHNISEGNSNNSAERANLINS